VFFCVDFDKILIDHFSKTLKSIPEINREQYVNSTEGILLR